MAIDEDIETLYLVTALLSVFLGISEFLAWFDCENNSITKFIYSFFKKKGFCFCCVGTKRSVDDVEL